MYFLRNSKGLSLLEAIGAFVIITIVILSAFPAFIQAQKSSTLSNMNTTANLQNEILLHMATNNPFELLTLPGVKVVETDSKNEKTIQLHDEWDTLDNVTATCYDGSCGFIANNHLFLWEAQFLKSKNSLSLLVTTTITASIYVTNEEIYSILDHKKKGEMFPIHDKNEEKTYHLLLKGVVNDEKQ